MRLWAASRPVKSRPESSSRSPAFQVCTSSRVRVSRFTGRASLDGVQVTSGQSSRFGGTSSAGPLPSSVK